MRVPLSVQFLSFSCIFWQKILPNNRFLPQSQALPPLVWKIMDPPPWEAKNAYSGRFYDEFFTAVTGKMAPLLQSARFRDPLSSTTQKILPVSKLLLDPGFSLFFYWFGPQFLKRDGRKLFPGHVPLTEVQVDVRNMPFEMGPKVQKKPVNDSALKCRLNLWPHRPSV